MTENPSFDLSDDDRLAVHEARQKAAAALGLNVPPEVRPATPIQISGPGDLAPLIEDTLLAPAASEDQIIQLCHEALDLGLHGVCVNPRWVSTAAQALNGSSLAVVAVAAFPSGAHKTAVKVHEAVEAATDGATEIDMVADLGALRSERLVDFFEDIKTVVDAMRPVPVKAILELGLLEGAFQKALAASLAALAGAAFVKTSTGFAFERSGSQVTTLGATVSDVELLSAAVGASVGVKAAGGISTYDKAVHLVQAGASRIGSSSGARLLKGGAQELVDY